MKSLRFAAFAAVIAFVSGAPPRPASASDADAPWVVLEGKDGPGKGKHIVLISGDQEYRSEETIPQLAKILANHHGFKCTVLFTTDPKTGTVNPTINNIQGLDALKNADLMVIFTRFLDLPDNQMKHVAEYVAAGKPVIGLRTSTHAFNIDGKKTYARFGNGSNVKDWEGGFGKQVLGEKWVAHHGGHGKEGTRGKITEAGAKTPILKGIKDGEIFGTTDVYTVTLPLPGDSVPLVLGEVTETLKPDSKAVAGKKNDPMMPVAWTKTYKGEKGDGDAAKTGRVFTTTMGASQDMEYEATRRMIVNACYWTVGLEDKIADKSNVDLVGEFKPTPFKFKPNDAWKPGVTPAELFK